MKENFKIFAEIDITYIMGRLLNLRHAIFFNTLIKREINYNPTLTIKLNHFVL